MNESIKYMNKVTITDLSKPLPAKHMLMAIVLHPATRALETTFSTIPVTFFNSDRIRCEHAFSMLPELPSTFIETQINQTPLRSNLLFELLKSDVIHWRVSPVVPGHTKPPDRIINFDANPSKKCVEAKILTSFTHSI